MKGEDKTTYVYGTPGKQSKESRRNKKTGIEEEKSESIPVLFGSLSIVGVGFVKIPPQFYEKGPFYV